MNFEIAPKSTETRLNWADAKLYCFFLTVDGKTGWRLPTKEELKEIYESKNDYVRNAYWSIDEFDTNHAWVRGFFAGIRSFHCKTLNCHVRAVRDLKDN